MCGTSIPQFTSLSFSSGTGSNFLIIFQLLSWSNDMTMIIVLGGHVCLSAKDVFMRLLQTVSWSYILVCLYPCVELYIIIFFTDFSRAIYNANTTYACVVWEVSMYWKYKMAADFKCDAGDRQYGTYCIAACANLMLTDHGNFLRYWQHKYQIVLVAGNTGAVNWNCTQQIYQWINMSVY